MTIMDKMNTATRMATQMIFDKDIPTDACLSDMEIAAALGTMAKASQMALLAALHQSYQLDVGMMLRKRLDEDLDWNTRLLNLMLNRGWLPHITKVEH